jgi:predicted lactoylglutathione lyase
MKRKLFINLAASDLKASTDFFLQLGFGFHPQFSDDTASCIVLSDDLYLMLLTKEKFVSFSPNPLINSHQQTEVLNCLSCHSKAEVVKPITSPKIMASCMLMVFRIWMAMSGNWCIWKCCKPEFETRFLSSVGYIIRQYFICPN